MRYARRVQVVEAQRWLGGKAPVSVLTGTGAQVHPDGVLLGITVPDRDQLLVLSQGDWLLRDERGHLSTMSATDFDAQFELAEVGQGNEFVAPSRRRPRSIQELVDILGGALSDVESATASELTGCIDDALEAFNELALSLGDPTRQTPKDQLTAKLLQPLDEVLARVA